MDVSEHDYTTTSLFRKWKYRMWSSTLFHSFEARFEQIIYYVEKSSLYNSQLIIFEPFAGFSRDALIFKENYIHQLLFVCLPKSGQLF